MQGRATSLFRLSHILLAVALAPTVFSASALARGDSGEPAIAYAARVLGDGKRTRLIVDFDRPVDHDVYLMNKPKRLVVDVDRTVFSLPDNTITAKQSLVRSMRYGLNAPDQSRMELLLTGPVSIETVSLAGRTNKEKQRLIVDILRADEETFVKAVRKPERASDIPKVAERQFTVMLDAGHGGIDGGAEGANGVMEKTVTLAFAKALRKAIQTHPRINVLMTRETDEFVSLRNRLKAIRASQANLMISVHADSLPQKAIRGATVYTLSEKGSDTLSRLLAKKENRSDMVAGLHLPNLRDDATDILIELTRRETEQFSVAFADNLVVTLKNVTRMINNPHRSASFHVLKSPEVPSILLELGYLSNPQDETQMANSTWQRDAAMSVASEVFRFLMPVEQRSAGSSQ